MAPSRRATKKWELFAGRNKFYCDGYLMTAPNSSIFYLTVVLITGTSGLFFAFDCPFLAERITPAIPIVGGILYIFTMCSLLRTAFSDPGIIPRASQDEAAYIEKQIEVPNSLNSPTYRPPPRTKEVFVRGQTVKLKYCFTCKIFRPPRASHCSLCDNCVDRFDHHCPWVGNCVGRRNYRFFYMFIVSLAFLAVFILACALTHLVLLQTEGRDFFDVIKLTPFSVVVSSICFLSVWSVIGLAGFHTYLTTSDQTTNEDIKGSFSTKSGQPTTNPYSHGNICLNCFFILCGPLQPSLIDRRGNVTEDYRLQMQTQDKFNGMPSLPPMVVQPVAGPEQIGKRYSAAEIDDQRTNTMAGVYRQRSYDNLQNEKSTSVAHLVENELPLASVLLPSTSTIDKRLGTNRSSISEQQLHPCDSNKIESELMVAHGNINVTNHNAIIMTNNNSNNNSNKNNNGNSNNINSNGSDTSTIKKLSGSYNNLLFREKNSNNSNIIIEGGNNNRLSDNSIDNIIEKRHKHYGEIISNSNNNDGNDIKSLENVYSNIPNALTVTAKVTSQTIPSILKAAATDHVYSNIDETISGRNNNNNNKKKNSINMNGINTNMSENLDLDLDDPLLTSSLIKKKEKPNVHNHYNIYNSPTSLHIDASTNKTILPSISSSSSTTGTQITSIELKNVLNMALKNNTTNNNNNNNNNNSKSLILSENIIQKSGINGTIIANGTGINGGVTGNRQETMIDTALDLDSLDGSSIGNNSQSCLVSNKAAIV